MKSITRRNLSLPSLILGAAVLIPSSANAGGASPNLQQPQQPQQQSEAQPGPTKQDPLAELLQELSPEQRQQIRAIREETKADRNAANQRLRQANLAYEKALDSDNPNEEEIAQRAREVGEAQTALLRARANFEIRIRRVLTPAQQTKLRELRIAQQEAQRLRRQEQRMENQTRRSGTPQNQRNGMAPKPGLPGQQRNSLPRKQKL